MHVASRLILITCLFLAAGFAQKSTVEKYHPTTEFDDSKPNSSDVPDAYAISGEFERVVVFRFKHQADLLAGITELVKKEGIENAVILSGIGSVRNSHVHAVSNRTFPSKNRYVKDSGAPADIVSVNGYIIDGRVHAHMTLTTGDDAFGGHIEPDNNVFTFAIVTLGVFADGIDLSKVDDKTYR